MDGSVSAFDALMSCSGNVMMVVQDLGSQGAFWDASASEVIEKDSILQGVML
jgi:hypothetical protein